MIDSNAKKGTRDASISRASLKNYDTNVENKLRPRFLDGYIGQAIIKANLNIALQAAKKRKESI